MKVYVYGSVLLTGTLVCAELWDASFTSLCNDVRFARIEADPSLANVSTLICGQDYSKDKPAAEYISIDLETCLIRNRGWEKSKLDQPSQWAGPLVGFLVPTLAFIVSIPRQWNFRAKGAKFDGGGLWSVLWMAWTFVTLTFDALVGIAISFGWAGPFMAGAIHEAFVDRAILNKIKRIMKPPSRRPTESEWFALGITLVGSFDASATEPQPASIQVQPGIFYPERFADKVKQQLEQRDTATRLTRQICSQLIPFGVQVGVPLVFYIGASIYALVDALARFGDNDTAHSIAFGLWYLTIVLVTVISSTVLGIGAPKVIESVLVDYHLTSKGYQLKWLSERRLGLWKWARERITTATGGTVGLDHAYADIFDVYFAKRAAFLSLLTLFTPCALAFTVSYTTPEIGISCRSATVLAYTCSQFLLTLLWLGHSSPNLRQKRDMALRHKKKQWTKYVALWGVTGMYYFVGILAFCITLGGTIMQLVGVYRNCICKAGLYYGLPTTRNRSNARVKLSTDTEADRMAASIWLALGAAGIGWIVIVCGIAAWHRLRMRERCLKVIDLLAER
jgi:hypothetical protein